MPYALFLLLFVILPIFGFSYLLWGKLWRGLVVRLIIVAVIAVVYTTPWDNYLVATRVWYYDPKLILGWVIGYVPIEEYSFFVLQTFLTGLLGIWLWRRFYPRDFEREDQEQQ
jgi:lycopene beta-cyclase